MNPGFVPPHLSLEFLAKAGMFHPHLPNLAGKFFHIFFFFYAFKSSKGRFWFAPFNSAQIFKYFKDEKRNSLDLTIERRYIVGAMYKCTFYNNFHFSAQLNIYLFDYRRHDLSELWASKYLRIIYNDSNINIQKRAIYTQSHHRYTTRTSRMSCIWTFKADNQIPKASKIQQIKRSALLLNTKRCDGLFDLWFSLNARCVWCALCEETPASASTPNIKLTQPTKEPFCWKRHSDT